MENGITFYQPDDLTAWMEEKENEEKVGEMDVGVVVSFGYFIPKKMIEKMKYGGINMHPSELPYYRGAAPLYYQLLFSDPSSAISVITLDPDRFDHGKVLLQWKFVIGYRTSSSLYFPFAAEFGAMGILRSLSLLPLLLSSSPSQSLLLSHHKTLSEKPFHYDNRSINHLIALSSSLPPPPLPPSLSSSPSLIADLNEISKITNGVADLVLKQQSANDQLNEVFPFFNKDHQRYGEKEVEVMVKRKKENILFFPKRSEEYGAISRALSEMGNDDQSLIEQERNEVMPRLGKGMRIFNSPKIGREMAEIKWSFFPSPLLIFSIFKSFSSSYLSSVNPYYVYTYFYRGPTKEGKEGTWIKVKWIDLSPIPFPLLFQLDDNKMKMKNGQAIFDKGKSNHLFVWFSFHPSLSLHFPISFNNKSLPFLSLLPSHFPLYHSSSHHPSSSSDHNVNTDNNNNDNNNVGKEEEKEEERKGWWMEVKKLQVEGGKVLTAREFANSYFSKSSPFFFSELPSHLSSSSN